MAKGQKTGKDEKMGQLIYQVIEKSNARSRQDLVTWRNALKAAEAMPRYDRNKLYDLYEEIDLDEHIYGIKTHGRRDILFAEAFRIVDIETGEEDKELTEFFQQEWFYTFMEHALDSEFWGHSLIQLGELSINPITNKPTISEVQLFPRKHVKPKYGEILVNSTDERGIAYRGTDNEAYWLVEVGSNDNLGLYNRAAKAFLLSKNWLVCWSEFGERFGIPMIVGYTFSRDQKDLDARRDELSEVGKGSVIVMHEGERIEIKENAKGDAFNVFLQGITLQEKRLSKLILGQTLTSDTGTSGTRAQGDVHADTLANVTESDKRLITNATNKSIFRLLLRRGMKVEGKKFEFKEQKDLGQLWTRAEGLLNTGKYTIPAQWIEDTFGIPVEAIEQNTDTPPSTEPPVKPVKKKEVAKLSFKWLDTLTAQMSCNCGKHLQLSKQSVKALEAITDKLLQSIYNNTATGFDYNYFNEVSGILIDGLVSGWQGKKPLQLSYRNDLSFGVDYDTPDYLALTLMEANLFKFSAGKTIQMVQELNALVPQSKTFNEFKNKAAAITGDYNANWMRTEYDFAHQVSTNAAEYYRMLADKDTHPYWQYVTAGDSRVRPAHKQLDKMTFAADDAAFREIYPPNGFGCRCYVKPLRSYNGKLKTKDDAITALSTSGIDKQGRSEYERMKKQGMNINRADLKEVFTANQQYTKEFGAKFGIKDNGVKPYTDIKQTDLPKLPLQERDKEFTKQWYEDNVNDGVVTDYSGRGLQFTKDAFESHLTEKYLKEGRQNIVEFIPDVLNQPDEVYLQQRMEGKYDYLYIKYYEDKPLAVVASFETDMQLSVQTWYELKLNGIDNRRVGLLIKKSGRI